MPIRPANDGSRVLEITREDGHRQIYRVPYGQEQAAMKAVLADWPEKLSDREAGLLLCGLNAITDQPAPSAAERCRVGSVRAFMRRVVDRVGAWLGGEEECCGK